MSGFQGSSETATLAETIRDLFFDRRDGVLSVHGGGRNDELYLQRGELFYCKTDAAGERLDQVLVKWGLVPQDKVASVVQRAGQDVRGALVREGVFPDEKAFDTFMSQVLRERMASVFTSGEARWEFEERDVASLRAVAFDTTTPNVILEGVRRMSQVETTLAALIEDDSALRPNPKPAVPLESLLMGPSEGYVLSLVDGATPVSAVVRTSPLGGSDTLRLLYALLVLDLLTHPAYAGYRFAIAHLARRRADESSRDAGEREAIEREYQRVRGLDIFHILPGLAAMEREERRAALKAWQEEWRASRFSERIRKEMRDQLTYLTGRAGEALLGLLDVGKSGASGPSSRGAEGSSLEFRRMELSKSEEQARLDELEGRARQYREHALTAIAKKDFHSAVQYLREAIRLHETAEDQERLGDALAMNPHWRRKAEEAYLRAKDLNRFRPEIPLKLGNLYAHSGMNGKARSEYEQALQIQPDHEEAKAALKALRRR